MKQYKHFGVMIDSSRNAVLKVSAVKKLIDSLQKMGYNTLELYTEDTFEVEGEPYFGYLRGRYSGEEIKEMDSYAMAHGIELIPCIQTLAHFTNPVRLPRFAEITDINDILLIDDPKTYEFIGRVFSSLAKNFTSRNVHIGMDEAHMVGLGKYLDKHGYCNRFEILNRHLEQVNSIAKKYGFTAHMWSDMFFRIASNGEYYAHGVSVPQDVREKVPNDVALVYWDYYHTQKKEYDAMMTSHKEFGRELWFAGGAWTWAGFAPSTRFTRVSMKPAMQSVRENGIENVLVTMWGDNGGECSPFTQLQTLYAIRRYADGEFDEDKIANEFERLFGVSAYDFDLLELPDIVPDITDEKIFGNPGKMFLYSDPFLGIFDKALERHTVIPYGEYAKKLSVAKTHAGEYEYLFETAQKLCELMEVKAYLGLRTRKAYRSRDKEALHAICADYTVVIERLAKFTEAFTKQWYAVNKPFGFEVRCARLGGVRLRLEHCRERLQAYICDKINCIEELQEDILTLNPADPDNLFLNDWRHLVSRSEM